MIDEAKKSYGKLERRQSLSEEQMEILRTKVGQEVAMNKKSLESLSQVEQPVLYGKIVQFQHIMSGSFLTLVPRSVAEKEKDCMRLCLDDEGNDGSWFKVNPRYKIRSEGENVYYGDQANLLNVKLRDHFLHSSPLKYTEETENGLG